MGEPNAESSLKWRAYDSDERGIPREIERAERRRLSKRLVASAGVVVESNPPGHMARSELGYRELSQTVPELAMTSITPSGQDGPFASYESSGLISTAMGGIMRFSGDPVRRSTATHGVQGIMAKAGLVDSDSTICVA